MSLSSEELAEQKELEEMVGLKENELAQKEVGDWTDMTERSDKDDDQDDEGKKKKDKIPSSKGLILSILLYTATIVLTLLAVANLITAWIAIAFILTSILVEVVSLVSGNGNKLQSPRTNDDTYNNNSKDINSQTNQPKLEQYKVIDNNVNKGYDLKKTEIKENLQKIKV